MKTQLIRLSLSLFIMMSVALSYAAVHPVTGEKLAADQTFVYRVLDESPSIDPQIAEDLAASEILRDLFEGLLNQDKDGNLVPGVAVSWKSTQNNTVHTFQLRRNAKWSNGDPVTAHDFIYAWKRAVDPKTASPYQWYIGLMSIQNADAIIKGEKDPSTLSVVALDDYTLQATLSKPLPYFVQMVVHPTTFPTHRKTIEKYGKDWIKPGNMVSNGAYVLSEYKLNEQSTRIRNKNYWNNEKTIIDKVTAVVINEENIALTRYLAQEVDRTEIPSGKFKLLQKKYPNQVTVFPQLCSYYYILNLSPSGPKALQDVRIRKALSYAIDRRVITDNILQGGQPQAYNLTPGATANFNAPEIVYAKWTQAERDKKAIALLKAAGYSKSNPLKFQILFNTSESHRKIALAVSQMWKQKLGVEATLNNLEWKAYLDIRGKQNFEVARAAWCGDYNEASTFLDIMATRSGYNDGKYSNAEVDELLSKASVAKDPNQNYTRIETILSEEMPIIPIYHYTGSYMLNERLKGWPYNNVQQNWYSKDLYKVAK